MVDYAAIGGYLSSQLMSFRPNFYDVDLGEFWALNPQLNFVKRNPDLRLGAQEIAFFTRKYFGQAAIYDGKGSDIPIVSHQTSMGKVPAIILIDGAEWNVFDLQAEQVANSAGLGVPRTSLTATNYVAMADFLNRREHYITLYGVPDRGVYGILDYPGIHKVDYAANNLYDDTVTPIQLYRLFISWIQVFMARAALTSARQVEIKVPERLLLRLTEPYSDQAPGATVHEMITVTGKGYTVASISSAAELEGTNLHANLPALPVGKDRIIFKASSDAFEQDYHARETTPEVMVNPITWQVAAYSGLSSVYAPRPARIMYVDFKSA